MQAAIEAAVAKCKSASEAEKQAALAAMEAEFSARQMAMTSGKLPRVRRRALFDVGGSARLR